MSDRRRPADNTAATAVLRYLHTQAEPVGTKTICQQVFGGEFFYATTVLLYTLLRKELVTICANGGYMITQGGVVFLAEKIEDKT